MARLSDGSGAAHFALKSIQSIALYGAVISALNSLVKEEYLYLNVQQKAQATYLPVLSHYIIKKNRCQ